MWIFDLFSFKPKEPVFLSQGYLLITTSERRDGKSFIHNYVWNKETEKLDEKKIFDISFITAEYMFDSLDDINRYLFASKALKKALEKSTVQNIIFVEMKTYESSQYARTYYNIRTDSTECLFNKKTKRLVEFSTTIGK